VIACPHRPPCTGCPRYGEPGIDPAAHAALDALARTHGLPPVAVVASPPAGFRLRARLAIRGRKGAPKLGLFAAGTHQVVTVPNCVVHHPLVNEASAIVRGALADAEVPPYSDQAQQGVARYLQVVVERRSQTAQIVLVANCEGSGPLASCLDRIRDRLDTRLHSLWFNAQTGTGNAVLGARFEHWCGPEAVVETFGGAEVFYPPGAFGQSNLDVAESIIAAVRDLVPQGARVAEFYAGVGAIGLAMVERVAELRLNEVAPGSLRGLELGLARLGPEARARITVHPGPAGEHAAMARDADVVIADPPRKGLDPALLAQLAAEPPSRFLYVSCGLESFLADTARLTGEGRLRLSRLTAYNLMPYTGHVETVAVFDRIKLGNAT
jgi:tRNA/tmRNA/rRNA uracil-C5-methylase (TrmA/RlmC/RlmD family)